jgi:predicted secreted protein
MHEARRGDPIIWQAGTFARLVCLCTVSLGLGACDLICRVIEHMRQEGRTVVEPVLPNADADMPRLSRMSAENFNAGYVTRAQHYPKKSKQATASVRRTRQTNQRTKNRLSRFMRQWPFYRAG